MANKKEVNILLLGIVAILAIVGLVLLFTSPAATGRLYQYPPLPPTVDVPSGAGADVVAPYGTAVQATPGQPCANVAPCRDGRSPTYQQQGIRQEGAGQVRIGVCMCPFDVGSPQTWVYTYLG